MNISCSSSSMRPVAYHLPLSYAYMLRSRIQYVPLEILFFISFLTEIVDNPQEYSFHKSGVKCLFQMMEKKITATKKLIKDILIQYFSFITFSSYDTVLFAKYIHSFKIGKIGIKTQRQGDNRMIFFATILFNFQQNKSQIS